MNRRKLFKRSKALVKRDTTCTSIIFSQFFKSGKLISHKMVAQKKLSKESKFQFLVRMFINSRHSHTIESIIWKIKTF